jgi:threonine dehydrogenase-like Zn-dependent dehydrogenase
VRAAVVVRANELEFREVPVPKPGPYQALVRIEACAICNATDVKIFHRRLPFVRADSYPGILGHEAVGTVIEADAKAKAFPIGARVLRPWAQVPGLGSFWGGFAEYGLVTDMVAAAAEGQEPPQPVHRGMQLVPPDIEPALATQLVTWKECLSYLTSLRAKDAEHVLVMGTGPVGLAMCALARNAFHVPDVVCLGRRETGLEMARRFGATATVNTAEVEPYAALREIGPEGFDVVVDAAGDADLVRLGLQVLKPDGRLGAYATEDSDKAPWLATATDARVDRGGCDESTAHDEMLELERNGTIDLSALITHTLPFSQLPQGLHLVETRAALKVVITITV